MKKLLIMIVCATMLVACGSNEKPKQEQAKQEEPAKVEEPKKVEEQKAEVKKEKELPKEDTGSLNMDLLVFIDNFNSSKPAQELGMKIEFEKGNLDSKENNINDTYQYKINDNAYLLLTLNKDTVTIKEAMVNTKGDGTQQSGINALSALLNTIKAVDPSIPDKELINIITDTGWKDQKEFTGTTSKNGINYTFVASEQLGLILTMKR